MVEQVEEALALSARYARLLEAWLARRQRKLLLDGRAAFSLAIGPVLLLGGCGTQPDSWQAKEAGDRNGAYTAVGAETLIEQIGFGPRDIVGAVISTEAYQRRCAEVDGRRVITDIGLIGARMKVEDFRRGYSLTAYGQRIPVTLPILQAQPPGTAHPYARSLWIDASEAPNLLHDVMQRCTHHICNYTISGTIRLNRQRASMRDPNMLGTCALSVSRYRYTGQNNLYLAIAGSAVRQAIEDNADRIVETLELGR